MKVSVRKHLRKLSHPKKDAYGFTHTKTTVKKHHRLLSGKSADKAVLVVDKSMTTADLKNADFDGDGVKNFMDCRPFDKSKQDSVPQKREMLQKYMVGFDKHSNVDFRTGFFRFSRLPWNKAKELLSTQKGLAHPNDSQTGDATNKQIFDVVRRYDGVIEGYVTEYERDDSRITFTGFTVNVPEKVALQIYNRLMPEKFTKTKKGYHFVFDD